MRSFLRVSSSTSGVTNEVAVRLRVAGVRTAPELGVLSDVCGGFHVARYDDVEAFGFTTSDTGTDGRFMYRLGDRLYFQTEEDRFDSVELPCGAKVAFDVRPAPPAGAVVTAHEKLLSDRASVDR